MNNIKELVNQVKNRKAVATAIASVCGISETSARNNYLSNQFHVPKNNVGKVTDILQRQIAFELKYKTEQQELINDIELVYEELSTE